MNVYKIGKIPDKDIYASIYENRVRIMNNYIVFDMHVAAIEEYCNVYETIGLTQVYMGEYRISVSRRKEGTVIDIMLSNPEADSNHSEINAIAVELNKINKTLRIEYTRDSCKYNNVCWHEYDVEWENRRMLDAVVYALFKVENKYSLISKYLGCKTRYLERLINIINKDYGGNLGEV